MNRPNIVVLGAGYGGMITTAKLQKMLGSNEANITLVNKHNYHYQTTWLHENAAGTLHHDRTRIKISDVINFNRVNFVQDTVVGLDPSSKKIQLENGELTYDYLVVGLGFEAATFGIQGLKEHAFTISNINAARLIREHIEYNFARYNNEKEERQDLLNIVVGGAGFTGIEFVGEIANKVPELCKEYDIPREKVRIINVEAAPTVLPGFDEELVEYAMNLLEGKGVEFKVGTMIKEVEEHKILVEKDEQQEEIPTNTVVWAAGVRGNSLVEEAGFETNRGRVPVRDDLRPNGYDDVFIVGDCALIMNPENDRPYPPTAQIAIQEAETTARNVKKIVNGEDNLESFKPDLKGTVASLGEGQAIGVVFGDKKLFGWTASVMKKIIDNRYLLKLGGIGLLLKKGKFNIFTK
ncbi:MULTISPECIES: NAD(P)/FAD-dependent oxidoreductase [Pontibacillus]|uniref:NAD(P)/FAD-dependent oxidoreductase n=1 Tax=Pontibacillus chungwhensis TaxID=265426 RepID=A0ABY8UUP9_9BACI|nr:MULTISPECIES: NAD(P)/FAD-dependent oxidoreductase [Pontibacillus]MCD5325146.1 NAD(P)/FAD-dependent oxidoreductase [Pontibacillus sp. HN14]WIF97395.1 NAD(P)/FAD-dependent oxidoreductase [Pontibacillus chungwhensis]